MIKIILQAPPQIISNLKRKLINHMHVLEQTEIKSKRKMLAKTSQHSCQKYSLTSNQKSMSNFWNHEHSKETKEDSLPCHPEVSRR